jgi:prolyl 4-hydroxylase
MKPVHVPHRHPLVIDRFVTPGMCRAILCELEQSSWHSSMVLRHGASRYQTEVHEDFRASLTTRHDWFSAGLRRLVEDIEGRLAATFGCDPRTLEWWQATRYERGDHFDYHLDAGSWGRSRAGERARTYLLFLDSPALGGETHFRALGVRVRPIAGRLLVWQNLLPSGGCDHAMVHAGLEVKRGVKTTLVTWERQRPVRRIKREELDDGQENAGAQNLGRPVRKRGHQAIRPRD